MIKTIQKGFTLIELLVVITIIGILATGAVTTFTSQIQKARDTTRISDVKALGGGIEQFYQDSSVYPQGGSQWTGSSGTQLTNYVPSLAEDPKHDQTCNGSRCGYVYTVGDDSVGIVQGAYEISTAFENQGNVTNRADNASDTGNDAFRLELGSGLPTNSLDTVQAQVTAFNGTVLGESDTSITLVVTRGVVTQK